MDEQVTVALRIRQFFRDLFGSRLTEHLETELLRIRNDYESRLLDKDRIIYDLRADLAALSGKIDRYELVLLPLTSPVGDLFRPKPKRDISLQEIPDKSAPTTWDEIQAKHYAQQAAEAAEEKNHGIQNEGRPA
jgi:hypothetical protein